MSEHLSTERPPPAETRISVVLPVYNEEAVLAKLHRRVAAALDSAGVDYELLFVDDGSDDGGPGMLDRLAAEDRRIRVIHFSRNFGHQAAVQAGIAHARGHALVLMDSDMQDAPEAIPRLIRQWRAGYDVVYAVRTRRKEGPLKRLLFAAFHRLMSRAASIRVPAQAGNFGLIDRRVAHHIAALAERDRYFPGLRSWVGFRQTGVDVERNARYDARPRVSLRGLVRLAKTALFSFSGLPLGMLYAIAVAAGGASMVLGGWWLAGRLFAAVVVPAAVSQLAVISFFAGLNALGLCVLGEYVVRIYDQVRARPPYVIQRGVNLEPHSDGEDRPAAEACAELLDEAARLLAAGCPPQDAAPPAERDHDESDHDDSRPVVVPMQDLR